MAKCRTKYLIAMVFLVKWGLGEVSKRVKSLKCKGVGAVFKIMRVWWWLCGRGVGYFEELKSITCGCES